MPGFADLKVLSGAWIDVAPCECLQSKGSVADMFHVRSIRLRSISSRSALEGVVWQSAPHSFRIVCLPIPLFEATNP